MLLNICLIQIKMTDIRIRIIPVCISSNQWIPSCCILSSAVEVLVMITYYIIYYYYDKLLWQRELNPVKYVDHELVSSSNILGYTWLGYTWFICISWKFSDFTRMNKFDRPAKLYYWVEVPSKSLTWFYFLFKIESIIKDAKLKLHSHKNAVE